MYKFFVIAAALACANAGLAPVAYSAAPALSYGTASYGIAPAAPLGYGHAALAPAAITSQSQNILRSYGNLGQVSTYSKTIDTPYSSVRKSDVRVSNPGLATVAHAPLAYAAAPAIAHAPLAYSSPIAHAPLAYSAAPAYAARAVATPVAHAGLLGVAYSAAPAVSHITFDGFGAHYGCECRSLKCFASTLAGNSKKQQHANNNRIFDLFEILFPLQFFVIAAALACANAGLAPVAYSAAPALSYGTASYGIAPAAPLGYGHAALAPAAITSQSQNILRSYGNLGQVSTYSKTIDTPYSSVRKSDVRVSNPGLATVAHAPLAYAAAPAIAHAPLAYAAAPAYAARAVAAPVAHAGLLGVAYSAAPAVSHITFDGFGAHYGWASWPFY
ncbi:unnamed protein product [Nesidiocoris tenuis]|uniref:Uncharacterized protein n=1 Tax=Nesidiocoris tenuis TaxID=355587 RepID=A0A6H5G618_9HEMI|nr:unnamed protein product [Nesidiocoris tenuis]